MDTKPIFIDIIHSPEEVMNKISTITITDPKNAHSSPQAAYSGRISCRDFEIKDVKLSPHSAAPSLKGEVYQHNQNSRIKLDIDIKTHYLIIRDMFCSTMIPIGLIVMTLSIYVLKDSGFLAQGIIFSSVFIVLPLVVAAITKLTLIKNKRKETENFLKQVNGKIVSA